MRKFGAAVVAVLTAWAFWAIAWRVQRANHGIRQLHIRTDLAALRETDDYTRAIRARENLASAPSLLTRSPQDQMVFSLAGKNAWLLGRSDEAEHWYSRSLWWGERPELRLYLADAQAAKGKNDAAIESLVRVVQFDPCALTRTNNPYLRMIALQQYERSSRPDLSAEVYLNIALGYLVDGFPDEGVEMLAEAAMRDPAILTRAELAGWSAYVPAALRRYAVLREQTSRR